MLKFISLTGETAYSQYRKGIQLVRTCKDLLCNIIIYNAAWLETYLKKKGKPKRKNEILSRKIINAYPTESEIAECFSIIKLYKTKVSDFLLQVSLSDQKTKVKLQEEPHPLTLPKILQTMIMKLTLMKAKLEGMRKLGVVVNFVS